MDYAIRWLRNCDKILCVTSRRKIERLSLVYPDLLFAIQVDNRDIWGAIRTALDVDASSYHLAMPDTILPMRMHYGSPVDLRFGVFKTNQPERFGVILDGRIRDKDISLRGTTQDAWGTIDWSRGIRNFWLAKDHEIQTFDQALTMAMTQEQAWWDIFRLESYQDIATREDYQKAIRT